jgi:DNA-binding winged helix-turn-helix (wHTH) protein
MSSTATSLQPKGSKLLRGAAKEGEMRLTATVLGHVGVRADGSAVNVGGPRQRRLLAALLVRRGAAVATDELVDAVFDGDPPDAAWRTFRTYVARLRRALDTSGADGSQVILTLPSGYSIADDLVVEADRFEVLLGSARDRLTVGDHDAALSDVEEALALWTGPAYGEFAGEHWARPDAVRLEELRLVARELHAMAMVESGRHVVSLYDYWREPGGAHLVTRQMIGGSLAARLADRSPILAEDASRLLGEIGDALVAAADRGVAHGRLSGSTRVPNSVSCRRSSRGARLRSATQHGAKALVDRVAQRTGQLSRSLHQTRAVDQLQAERHRHGVLR